MENIAVLDDIVKDLERNDNLIKIKKLLLCSWQGKWENDEKKLEALDLSVLVKEVYKIAPTYGDLKSTLIQVVKKLNKKVQYFLIANTLIQKLSKLYPESVAKRKRIRTQLRQLKKGVKYPYDLYDLKYSISRESTLRLAKILVFSALNYKFAYSTQDWATLDSLEFDELVRSLFYACETPEDLEFRLYGTAACLEDPEKQLKTASIIVESMLPYYQYLQKGRDITEDVDEDEITELQLAINSRNNTNLVLSDSTKAEQDNDSANFVLVTTKEEVKVGGEENDIKLSESLKKQLEIEASVRGIVKQRVEEVVKTIENSVRDLEVYLDQQWHEEISDVYLPFKYQTLRNFVQDIQLKSLEILQKLEEREKRN